MFGLKFPLSIHLFERKEVVSLFGDDIQFANALKTDE